MYARSDNYIFMPFYHIVSEGNPKHIRHLYKFRSTSQFLTQLDQMLRIFEPIEADLLNLIQIDQRQQKRPSMLLSFDDGLFEMQELSHLLMKKGVPAIFFVCSDFVQGKELFYRHKASILVDHIFESSARKLDHIFNNFFHSNYDVSNVDIRFQIISWILATSYEEKSRLDGLAISMEIDFLEYVKNNKVYLNEIDIADLLKSGFSIGAHSENHPRFSEVAGCHKRQQVLNSLRYLHERFGINYRGFAFPFSDKNCGEDFLRALHRENVVPTFGTRGLFEKSFGFHFQRICLDNPEFDLEICLDKLGNLYK